MYQDNQNISFSAISYIVFENFFLHRKCTLMCNICFTILHRWFRGIASSSLRSTTPFSSAMGRATLRCFFPCLAKDIQIEYQTSTTDFLSIIFEVVNILVFDLLVHHLFTLTLINRLVPRPWPRWKSFWLLRIRNQSLEYALDTRWAQWLMIIINRHQLGYDDDHLVTVW